MDEFLKQVKQYNFKVALGNQLISFTKWFVGAKRIRLTYKERVTQKTAGRHIEIVNK